MFFDRISCFNKNYISFCEALAEIRLANEAVVSVWEEEDSLSFFVIIGLNGILFKKDIDGILTVRQISFDKCIFVSRETSILLDKIKESSSFVYNKSFFEYVANIFKNTRMKYKISFDEEHLIIKYFLNMPDFFENHELDNRFSEKDRWVD